MNKSVFEKITTWFLYFGVLFMIGESLIHFSGIRLGSAGDWPQGALSFAYFFQCLWASVSLLIALILFLLAKNKQLWGIILLPIAAFAVFHGIVLFWWSLMPLPEIWEYPSLFVWNPWYPLQLKIEAVVLWIFAAWIGYGCTKGWLKK